MAYDPDKTWDDFTREVQQQARATIRTLAEGSELYKDLIHYSEGKTTAQMATALGRTEADINAMSLAIDAFKQIYDCSEGVAVAQANYANNLRTFS